MIVQKQNFEYHEEIQFKGEKSVSRISKYSEVYDDRDGDDFDLSDEDRTKGTGTRTGSRNQHRRMNKTALIEPDSSQFESSDLRNDSKIMGSSANFKSLNGFL